MFKVQNADFIADKLAAELLPDQEYREAAKNAEEAILRRIERDDVRDGRIEFDVDWSLLSKTGQWFLCCADNGDGMSREELELYTTTLAVEGANRNQSLSGNQGMGLKISGPTRHRRGVLIRSLKNRERSMVQIGWNEHEKEYGLIPMTSDGDVVVSADSSEFPNFINLKGSGTIVTFLGNEEGDNTFRPPAKTTNGWLLKYLNKRFFRFSHDGIEMVVRVPSGSTEDWPTTPEAASDRESGKVKPSFNRTRIKGTASVWDDAADKLDGESRGAVELAGDRAQRIPRAVMHWWVLPTGPGSDVSTRTASGGSLSVCYQNELHDWHSSSQANPHFARLGVLFGKQRVGFVLEPDAGAATSDFARAHVLVGGTSVFKSDAWLLWSEQFRDQLPEPIKAAMAEEQARIQVEDPDRAKRIRDRLKDVMSLLRPRRFRLDPTGGTKAGGPEVSGSGQDDGSVVTPRKKSGNKKARGTGPLGIGAVLAQIDPDDGEPAEETTSIFDLEPMWVTEKDAEGIPIVNGNGKGLGDRAAALAGEHGASANMILLNLEFRGYQSLLAAVNEQWNLEGDEDKAKLIEGTVQEWIEQKMVEAVNGLRQLENGTTWLPSHFDDALSPVALTAAFMADRYHTLRAVNRVVTSRFGSRRSQREPEPAEA